MFLYDGLLPRNTDIVNANLPVAQKREALLTAALDNDLLHFIMSCVQIAGSPENGDDGYGLRFLLDWALGRVSHIKESIDRLCEPLYDWSGAHLDSQTTQVLRQHQTRLAHLATIFQSLGAHSLPMTSQGRIDLEIKQEVVDLIRGHLNACLLYTSPSPRDRQKSRMPSSA